MLKVPKIVKKGDNLQQGMESVTSYIVYSRTWTLFFLIGPPLVIPITAPDHPNAYIVPLGADKKRHCKSQAHLIEMCCKRQFFKQYDFNTFIFCGPTLGSDHRSHSPCH